MDAYMMSAVVQIALAIQEEEAAWTLRKIDTHVWFAERHPLEKIGAMPIRRDTASFDRYYLGSDETKAREDFKNRVAIACAKAVLLIIGAEPKRERPERDVSPERTA